MHAPPGSWKQNGIMGSARVSREGKFVLNSNTKTTGEKEEGKKKYINAPPKQNRTKVLRIGGGKQGKKMSKHKPGRR